MNHTFKSHEWIYVFLFFLGLILVVSGCEQMFDEDSKNKSKYSVEPMQINLEGTDKVFVIPRNYFGPNYKNDPDKKTLTEFGLTFYMPGFEGFTADMEAAYPNIGREFNDQYNYMIRVLWLRSVSQAMVKSGKMINPAGEEVEVSPAAWGDAKAMYENGTKGKKIIREEYGLICKGPELAEKNNDWVHCLGKKSNGEWLLLKTYLSPHRKKGVPYLCDIHYYSQQEQLNIRYSFSRSHLAKWREIDDKIWEKLHSWEVK